MAQVSVLQETFAAALKRMKDAVDSKHPLPVLHYVRLTARVGSGVAYVVATDLEVAQRVQVGAKVNADFDALLHYDTVARLVPRLSPERLDMSAESEPVTIGGRTGVDYRVVMQCGNNRSRLKSIDVSEYPAVPELPDHSAPFATLLEPDLSAFKDAAAHVAHSTADHGVWAFVRLDAHPESGLTLSAGNGFALATVAVPAEVETAVTVLVPPQRLAKALAALANDEVYSLSLTLTDSYLCLSNGVREVFITLPDAAPKDLPTCPAIASATLDTPHTLLPALKAAGKDLNLYVAPDSLTASDHAESLTSRLPLDWQPASDDVALIPDFQLHLTLTTAAPLLLRALTFCSGKKHAHPVTLTLHDGGLNLVLGVHTDSMRHHFGVGMVCPEHPATTYIKPEAPITPIPSISAALPKPRGYLAYLGHPEREPAFLNDLLAHFPDHYADLLNTYIERRNAHTNGYTFIPISNPIRIANG